MLFRLAIAALALIIFAIAGPAGAATRIALVIGNSDYRNVPNLPNPANDAADMGAAFERLGFAVTSVSDLDYEAMRRALRDFSEEATGAEVAAVFFAGHGFEIDGRNYLVPVDARLASDRDASFEAVPLDLVLDAVGGATGLRLVLLDACRDNPFLAAMSRTDATRSVGRGLSRIEPATGTLVSYAAKEGTTAADGDGRNSPYTSALIEHLSEPGLEVSFLFRKVRDSVLAATANRQEPFTYGSLPGRAFYLNAAASETDLPEAQPRSGSDTASLDLAYWQGIKDSDDPALIESYLAKFPDGVFVELARARLAALKAPGKTAGDAAKAVDSGSAADGQSPGATETGGPGITFEVQRELARLGCDPGEPDGVWGPNSEAALARYARAAGAVPRPGGPSAALLERLTTEPSPICAAAGGEAATVERPAADAPTQPAETTTFRDPQLADLPLDVCVAGRRFCGGAAANMFCKKQGYRNAISHDVRPYPATQHIVGGPCRAGPGQRCRGYSLIVCAR